MATTNAYFYAESENNAQATGTISLGPTFAATTVTITDLLVTVSNPCQVTITGQNGGFNLWARPGAPIQLAGLVNGPQLVTDSGGNLTIGTAILPFVTSQGGVDVAYTLLSDEPSLPTGSGGQAVAAFALFGLMGAHS